MGLTFQQEDTATTSGQQTACDSRGDGVSGNAQDYLAVDGGTPGVGIDIMGNVLAFSDQICLMFELEITSFTNWLSGIWTVPINVIVGNGQLKWEALQVCRLDAGGSNIEQLGIHDFGGTPVLMFSGIQFAQVTCINVPAPGAGDSIFILCNFSSTGLSADTVTMTPDQIITTPFSESGITECTPGQFVVGGFDNEMNLTPKERPIRPENPLDILVP